MYNRFLSKDKCHVLIIDGNRTDASVASGIFASDKVEVIRAKDGAEAWNTINVIQPSNLVLMELGLRGVSGFELLRHIRSKTRWDDTPIVVASGVSNLQSVKHAISLGAAGFIRKPYDIRRLKDELQKFLGGDAFQERKFQLLLVDDEEPILASLKRSIRNEGYTIDAYSDPAEALKQARRTAYDLVISDYRMPEMNGVDLLIKIRELRPHALRLILSGYTDKDAMIDAINRARIHRFIQKPWDASELRSYIAQALKQADNSSSDDTADTVGGA